VIACPARTCQPPPPARPSSAPGISGRRFSRRRVSAALTHVAPVSEKAPARPPPNAQGGLCAQILVVETHSSSASSAQHQQAAGIASDRFGRQRGPRPRVG
jgi:hypothetical protein